MPAFYQAFIFAVPAFAAALLSWGAMHSFWDDLEDHPWRAIVGIPLAGCILVLLVVFGAACLFHDAIDIWNNITSYLNSAH